MSLDLFYDLFIIYLNKWVGLTYNREWQKRHSRSFARLIMGVIVDKEIWIVHCLYIGTGKALIGTSTSRKNANTLYKQMCNDLSFGEGFSAGDFSKTIKKVTSDNTVVIDLT